jgi:asparagine synthase (glutamine-hydrolysing)
MLDHRVLEFAWRLPNDLKVRRGGGKWILRQLLRRFLPESLVERPKQGFDVPVGTWLRGPLRAWASDLIADLQRTGDEIVDARGVEACWRSHLAGGQDHSRELWPALMFQAWRHSAEQGIACDKSLSRERELSGV